MLSSVKRYLTRYDPTRQGTYKREIRSKDASLPRQSAIGTWQQPRYKSLPTCTEICSGYRLCLCLRRTCMNIYRITVVYHNQPVQRTATEIQDSILREPTKSASSPSGLTTAKKNTQANKRTVPRKNEQTQL